MLSRAIAAKFFQPIAGRYAKVLQRPCMVEHTQLPKGYLLNFTWQRLRVKTFIDLSSFLIMKRLDHDVSIWRDTPGVKHPIIFSRPSNQQSPVPNLPFRPPPCLRYLLME
jgi:hypothetical protein